MIEGVPEDSSRSDDLSDRRRDAALRRKLAEMAERSYQVSSTPREAAPISLGFEESVRQPA